MDASLRPSEAHGPPRADASGTPGCQAVMSGSSPAVLTTHHHLESSLLDASSRRSAGVPAKQKAAVYVEQPPHRFAMVRPMIAHDATQLNVGKPAPHRLLDCSDSRAVR